jgi:mRNA-degrading endonuclease RelE of RelBE toxin-antitoxin system
MELLYTSEFKRALRKLNRRYRSLREDLSPLLASLEAGKTPGDPLQHNGYTTFKVRVKNSDAQRGKSGGYRVIYYLKTADSVLLVTLYCKSTQSDVEPNEVKSIIDRYPAQND